MRKKILMAERSDLYHDARVQKEAESLQNNGFDLRVIGLRGSKLNHDNEFPYRMDTNYVVPRDYRLLRKIHLFLLILYINMRIIFIKSEYYHSHNTYFLPGMYLAKLLYGGILVYDSHEVQWESNKIAKIEETNRHSIKDILEEGLQHELHALSLYKKLLASVGNASVYLEEYARGMISEEEQHSLELKAMLKDFG